MINVDDPYGARLARDFPQALRIGLDAPEAQVRATAIEGDASGSAFAVDGLALLARAAQEQMHASRETAEERSSA